MSRDYNRLRVTHEQGVARVTLYNPERRNAIGPEMTNELLYALQDATADVAVRAIVMTGEGKAFCAGGDFSQMATGAESSSLPYKGDYADLLLALVRAEKPTIARVNGHAMGGGLGLVAACHFAVGTEGAQLGTPEINVGLFPMMIMAVLARHVPRRRLLQMMLFGEKLNAMDAKSLGLLGSVVPESELDASVQSLVEGICSKSPMTVKLGLRAFAAQDDLDLAAALPMLREKLGECLGTDDAREGLMAFLQKRPAVWTGK